MSGQFDMRSSELINIIQVVALGTVRTAEPPAD